MTFARKRERTLRGMAQFHFDERSLQVQSPELMQLSKWYRSSRGGGAKGPWRPKFLAYLVVCVARGGAPSQILVVLVSKSKYLALFGLAAPLGSGRVGGGQSALSEQSWQSTREFNAVGGWRNTSTQRCQVISVRIWVPASTRMSLFAIFNSLGPASWSDRLTGLRDADFLRWTH